MSARHCQPGHSLNRSPGWRTNIFQPSFHHMENFFQKKAVAKSQQQQDFHLKNLADMHPNSIWAGWPFFFGTNRVPPE